MQKSAVCGSQGTCVGVAVTGIGVGGITTVAVRVGAATVVAVGRTVAVDVGGFMICVGSIEGETFWEEAQDTSKKKITKYLM